MSKPYVEQTEFIDEKGDIIISCPGEGNIKIDRHEYIKRRSTWSDGYISEKTFKSSCGTWGKAIRRKEEKAGQLQVLSV